MTTLTSQFRESLPDRERIGRILQASLQKGEFRPSDQAVIFYDLDFLSHRIQRLVKAFPEGTLHGLAIKANPLLRIMEWSRNLDPGIGVEAASFGEVLLALEAGYAPSSIVYDSPVKTVEEIGQALALGVHLNVDNLSELDRVSARINTHKVPGTSKATIGIRINPQIGVGSILESSVAGEYSKFGVPIRYHREQIVKSFLDHEWLSGLHLHVGSQGCPMSMLTEGIGILYDLMLEINDTRQKRGLAPVATFDIGGGLPVAYLSSADPPAIEDYVVAIRKRAPGLFADGFLPAALHREDQESVINSKYHKDAGTDHLPVRLITEFGRWTYTNSGWTASRVEYVKHDPAINTAMLHVGADLFVRECLNPKAWPHEYTVFDSSGQLKTGTDERLYNLAGPLCFSGDIIARDIALPRVEEGDILVIHDTGSYTFSMWSRYNSRFAPRILGYHTGEERFEVLKERETQADLVRFWK